LADWKAMDLWGVERILRRVLLVPPWVCLDKTEEKRLAALKLLLQQQDLLPFENKKVIIGRTSVLALEAFPTITGTCDSSERIVFRTQYCRFLRSRSLPLR
jgi:hypothetical protein